MKKILTLCAIALYATLTLTAQPPQAMKYKAIAKDEWGVALPSKEISLRFTIYQGSEYGTTVYIETHQTTTNKFGLVDVNIGEGTPQTGIFSNIDWGADDYYLKIELDPKGGIDFRMEDESHQLLSVPYALYAGSVLDNDDNDSDPTNELQVLTIRHDTIFLSDGGFVKLPAVTSSEGEYYYMDKDNDGYGDPFKPTWVPEGVTEPDHFINNSTDCNDDDEIINPAAIELIGDGIDNNCNGEIDETGSNPDEDNDGDGFTENEGDCDDTNADIYPGAPEIRDDGIDQDCDGNDLLNRPPIAEDDQYIIYEGETYTFFVIDNDWDPDGDNIELYYHLLEYPDHGYVHDIWFAFVEYTSDPGFIGEDSFTYIIFDEFGAQDEATVTITILPNLNNDTDEDGFTENDGDCDDSNDEKYPGAPEVCGDGIDQDCDGNDLACP